MGLGCVDGSACEADSLRLSDEMHSRIAATLKSIKHLFFRPFAEGIVFPVDEVQ